jgi:hypothetical protein
MRLYLQIKQPNVVAVPLHRRGDQFQAQRFQSQEDPRVHQRTRMDGEHLHRATFPQRIT